jgi:PAS domain S-box-containing protein
MGPPEEPASDAAAQQVNDLFDSEELTKAIETEEFRIFLDHIPMAIAISRLMRGDQRIIYVNKAYEALTGETCSEVRGRGWSILDSFKQEDEPHLTFSESIRKGDDYLGTFQRTEPKLTLVEAYTGVVENEDTAKTYRIVALIDVTARERAQRDEFARQIRDKDVMLKEIQHRVKNNLQLVAALIRLEARSERKGDKVNLDRLAGRIEALQLLYQAMSPEAWGDDVELGHYVNQIASAVMATYGVEGIRLDLKIDTIPASINVAMPVGLIVNELMINAFKYAFNGRGTGVIALECLQQNDGQCRILVADDGMGLPEGISWPVVGKIGALVLQILRENTETDVNVESASGKGTRVTIKFAPQAPVRKQN